MTQHNLITIVTMWNKVNELSHENRPQQQIVISSFHQCQQGSASSQCQCHSSNILVNANPSHPPPIQNHPTLLYPFTTKTVPAKRSKRYKPHPNAHFAPTKSFYRYEIANPKTSNNLAQKNTKVNVTPPVTQSHNTKTLIHNPPKKTETSETSRLRLSSHKILPNNSFLYTLHNIPNIFIRHIRTYRQAEPDLEQVLLHTICINRGTLIHRLLVHRLPNRTTLDLLGKHKHAQRLHILIRLTIRRSAIHRMNHTCSTANSSLEDLLVILL